jgi:putative membrane protein
MHALTALLLAVALVLYVTGVTRLWRKAGAARGVSLRNAACFAAGWFTLAFALLSPLHHLAEERLWAHMVQHELLMVVAAPLFVLARPLEAWAWASRHAAEPFLALRQTFRNAWLAWSVHAAAVLLWHIPAVFGAAVHDPVLHFAQHASFFGSALVFWWSILAPGAQALPGIASAFTTMLYTGALGALMALSRTPWYAGYALEDQQLAGLVMWVPAGLAYPAAAAVLLGANLSATRSGSPRRAS